MWYRGSSAVFLMAALSLVPARVFVSVRSAAVADPMISFRSSTSAANATSTTLSIAKPAAVIAGDVLVAGLYVSSKTTTTAPRGWVLARHSGRAYAYYRVASSSTAISYVWTFASAVEAAGVIAAYTGVDVVAPANAVSGQTNSWSTFITAPSAATTANATMLVGLFGISRKATIAHPAGMTERAQAHSSNAVDNVSIELSEVPQPGAGSTGDRVATASLAGPNAGQLLALSPASAPALNRAFSDSSYWNTPLPADAPVDPNSDAFMAYMQQNSTTDYVSLAGAASEGKWGRPVYWSKTTDPEHTVVAAHYALPPEFQSLRIPIGAQPDSTSDSSMTIYDVAKGYVAGLWQAAYDAASDTWSAGGGEVYYLESNGLDGSLPQSDDPRNRGHRGLATPMDAVGFGEIQAGAIDHVLKVSIYRPGSTWAFPMTGSDGRGTGPSAPPEGARLRLKPSIDLGTFGLTPAQYAVAKAAQHYGLIIGDGSGGQVSVALENVVAEGRGWLWNGVLRADSLQMFPLSDYEVVQLGYGA